MKICEFLDGSLVQFFLMKRKRRGLGFRRGLGRRRGGCEERGRGGAWGRIPCVGRGGRGVPRI